MVDKIGSVGQPEVSGAAGPAGVPAVSSPSRSANGDGTGVAFDRVLQQQIAQAPPAAGVGLLPAVAAQAAAAGAAGVRFSAHAQQRLAQAAVQLGPQQMTRLEAAVDKAGSKGGRESLILLDDLAFVVSVKNRTVITAVGADRMADNVFTKIDSVVIARQDELDPQGKLSPAE